jgi:hypothetical protein
MKHFAIAIVLFACLSVAVPKKAVVHAQADRNCPDSKGNVSYIKGGKNGWDIAFAAKTAPPNPIVVGQDKDHVGVDIKVDIVSYPGSITYLKDAICTGFETPQSDLTSCDPYYKDDKYFYWKINCPTENDVYRYIDGTSLKVWLDPDQETEQWLGWSEDAKGWPLRYMYPEKWSLGTWTPGGFTTVGDNGLWTEEQIKKFEAEHPGYNFLESDPRIGPLPTVTMKLASDPLKEDQSKPTMRRVIALFGDFTDSPWDKSFPKGYCHVGYPGFKGNCGISINAPDDPVSDLFGGVDTSDPTSALFGGADVNDPQKAMFGGDTYGTVLERMDIHRLTLTLKNVPLDLPGLWRIGIMVHVEAAKYDNTTRTEIYDVGDLVKPYSDYVLKDHSLLVYLYISTPCNIQEPEGCKN